MNSGRGTRSSGCGAQGAPTIPSASVPRREIVLWVLLALAARGAFWAHTRFTGEDALITLRVSRNLAEGNGFTYQEGERIQASSTPLFALVCGTAGACGADVVATAKGLGCLADVLAVGFLAYGLARELSLATVRVAVAAYALSPYHTTWAVSGMETGLVNLLSVLTWFLWAGGARWSWGIAAGFLMWCRPDGGLLVAVLTGVSLIRERAVPWRAAAAAALVLLPWTVFAWSYFGTPVPSSISAKWATAGVDLWGAVNLQRVAWQFVGKIPVVSPLLAALFVLGLARSLRGRPATAALAVWVPVTLAAFLASRVRIFEWYLVPPLAGYLTGIACAVEPFLRRFPTRAQGAVLSIVLVAGGAMTGLQAVKVRLLQDFEESVRQGIGEWLREESPPGASVAIEPIGYVGYYSRLQILDTSGRASPEVLAYYSPDRREMLLRMAGRNGPEWIIERRWVFLREAEIVAGSWRYRRVRTFSGEAPAVPEWNRVFDIYRRVD